MTVEECAKPLAPLAPLDECALEIKEIVERKVLDDNVGRAIRLDAGGPAVAVVDAVVVKLKALIWTESVRGAAVCGEMSMAATKEGAASAAICFAQCHDEILRTSPGRLDVKYDRAMAPPATEPRKGGLEPTEKRNDR